MVKINLEPVPRKRMLKEVRRARPDEVIPDDIDAQLLFAMWLRA